MFNTKKLLTVVVAAVFLAAAAPLSAELEGHWEGEGDGWCYSPDGSNIPVYAWQTWQGDVDLGSIVSFTGTWADEVGHEGGFSGSIIALSQTTAICQGTWTLVTPDGAQPIVMGPFHMTFHYAAYQETCEGYWSTPEAVIMGTMWGERTGD
jgi:hypothetical protein